MKKELLILVVVLSVSIMGCGKSQAPAAPLIPAAPVISEHDQQMFCMLGSLATSGMALRIAMKRVDSDGDGGEKIEMEKLSQTDGTILENVKAQANMAMFYESVHPVDRYASSRSEAVCNEVMDTARKYGYDSPKVAIVAKKYYYPKKW